MKAIPTRLALLLLLPCLAAWCGCGHADPPPPALRVVASEERLAVFEDASSISAVQVSPNGKGFACHLYVGDRNALYANGKLLKHYDNGLRGYNVLWSPNGDRFIYMVVRGDRHFQIESVTATAFCDDFMSRTYVGIGQMTFSADSRHFAYIASDGNHMGGFGGATESFAVVNGVEGKSYTAAWDLALSPTGDRVAYCALNGLSEHELEMEARRLPHMAHRLDVGIAHHMPLPALAAALAPPPRPFVVANGQEGKAYDHVQHPTFSPNGQHLAFVAVRNRKNLVVMDGIESAEYDRIVSHVPLVFSPDSRHLAYCAQRGQKCFLVMDGVEGPEYSFKGEYANMHAPVFSPDSRRVAYAVRLKDESVPVVDGKEQRPWPSVRGIAFSPDSKRLAFASHRGKKDPFKYFVVTDGQAHKEYDATGQPIFSPDSRHVAYWVKREDKTFLVVDGVEAHDCGREVQYPFLRFESPDTLFAIYPRGKEIIRATVRIAE